MVMFAAHLQHARGRADAEAEAAARRSEELVQARQAVDRLARDAQRRARDFSTLFEEAPIGLGIAEDVECRTIVPNRALAEMLGVTPGENISQSAGRADRIPLRIAGPDGTPLAVEELSLQRAARTGLPVRGMDVDVVRPDGTRISLLEYAAPLLDDDGQPRGAIGAFLDVSARRRTPRSSAFSATPPGCSTPRSTTRRRSASWSAWPSRRWPTTRCSTSSPRRARWSAPAWPTATRRARPSCATRWC